MKTQQPLAVAAGIAAALVAELTPYCTQIEVAGSVRRRKAQVGDLEIVAIPTPVTDLFGEPTGVTQVDDWLDVQRFRSDMPVLVTKNGPRYKQFLWQVFQVDLFLATPTNYGYLLMLRTGDEDFSHRMVTLTTWGGFKPADLTVKDGYVWRGGQVVPVPTEQALFDLWGLDWIAPEQRTCYNGHTTSKSDGGDASNIPPSDTRKEPSDADPF